MYFVNPIATAQPTDINAVNVLLQAFHTKDEVRVAWDNPELATALNTLADAGHKFYLVCLPEKSGWVLRRHRPTGQYHGTLPRKSAEPAGQPVPATTTDAPGSDAQPVDQGTDRQYAEDVFGNRAAAVPGHAAAPAASGQGDD